MSDTPRTDAAEWNESPQASVRVLCRQLERELNAALDALSVIGEKHDKELEEAKGEIARLNRDLEVNRDQATALCEQVCHDDEQARKDAQ